MEQEIRGKNKRHKNFIDSAKDAGGGSGVESGDAGEGERVEFGRVMIMRIINVA